MTPQQKREKAAAEARKQAMLDAGMSVAGLQAGGAAPKRPFTKKKLVGKGKPPVAEKGDPHETEQDAPESGSPGESLVSTSSTQGTTVGSTVNGAPASVKSTTEDVSWEDSDDDAAIAVEDGGEQADETAEGNMPNGDVSDDWDEAFEN